MAAAQALDIEDDRVGRDARSLFGERGERLATTLARPLVLGALMALLALNLTTLRPVFGIDSSFRIGLAEALRTDLRFGDDVTFPYGPLGFLAGPTLLSRGQLALGILYQLVTLTVVFATLADQLRRYSVRTRWIVLVLVPVAVALSITDNVLPEFVALAIVVVLAAWRQREAAGDRGAIPTWLVLGACGLLAGVQLLVKFGTGAVLAAAVVWFSMTCRPRIRNIAVALGAILLAGVGSWLATGQRLADLLPFIGQSLDLAAGYQEAQAYGPSTTPMAIAGLALIFPVAVLAFGSYRWFGRDRRAALWPLAMIAAATWFALKQGLIRWDRYHVLAAYLMVALLIVAIPWERRFRALPVAALGVAALITIAGSTDRLAASWSDRVDALAVLVSPGRQTHDIADARAGLRATYAVPGPVIAALDGGSVHAEQAEVAAVWGHELAWRPVPVFQTYSAYTARLDRMNQDRFASSNGPDGVLLNDSTIDSRYGLWESPDARVALTCNFVPVASDLQWTALQRAPNVCGTPRELGVVSAAPGAPIEVPLPSDPNSLVVAHFDLPSDPIRRVLQTLARPIDYASVRVDGDTEYRLITGTAEGAHLVRSPGEIDGRPLPHGPIAHTELSFDNVGGGDVVVRFEEIPLHSS